jgi:hypothetical protein
MGYLSDDGEWIAWDSGETGHALSNEKLEKMTCRTFFPLDTPNGTFS